MGRITQITDPAGGNWIYAYDANGDLETVTDPDTNVTTYTYLASPPNPAHYLESIIDPFGRTGLEFEYDADGRLFAIIDEQGERLEQTWDPGSFTGTMTDRRGNTVQLVYDARGNVTSQTDADMETFTFAYGDPLNPDRPTSRTDPLGQTTTIEYDAMGNVTKVFADGSFFANYEYTYDAAGRILTGDFSGGRSRSYSYDGDGNLTQLIDEYGHERNGTYTPEGNLATETIGGTTRTFSYDPATGNLASRTGPNGPTATYTYDGRGNVTGVEDAFGDTFGSASRRLRHAGLDDRSERRHEQHRSESRRIMDRHQPRRDDEHLRHRRPGARSKPDLPRQLHARTRLRRERQRDRSHRPERKQRLLHLRRPRPPRFLHRRRHEYRYLRLRPQRKPDRDHRPATERNAPSLTTPSAR